MSPTATSTESNPTHHITLSASGTTYGLILIGPIKIQDPKTGKTITVMGPDPKAITRTPMPRTSTAFVQE